MVPSTWINIYDTLKNGEIDSIDLNSYQNNIYPLNNNIITFQINTATRKIKSRNRYTIGLKYLLNNYDVNFNRINDDDSPSPVTIARKYLKMPVQISSNTRLEEFIQPIKPDKNYVFYFPYYISSDPSIENGSYPVAPIQDEVGGNFLTFPPNVTLVFESEAFLKLGGTLFNVENAGSQGVDVLSMDYKITIQDVNQQRAILRESESLWPLLPLLFQTLVSP